MTKIGFLPLLCCLTGCLIEGDELVLPVSSPNCATTSVSALRQGILSRDGSQAPIAPEGEFLEIALINGRCTAVLIGESRALTAAHCLCEDDKDPNTCASTTEVAVRVKGGWASAPGQVFIHPELRYDYQVDLGIYLIRADLAVIVLDRPFPGSAFLALRQDEAAVCDRGIMAGFAPLNLAQLRIAPNYVVQRRGESFFVSGDAAGEGGDSGGPYMTNNNGRQELAGILSQGFRRTVGALYVDTSHYRQWILEPKK